MATLMKSSECEYKAAGRDRARWLRNAAQAALEQALRSEWVDASLAEAALVSRYREHSVSVYLTLNLDAGIVRILRAS
jgi:hypothetical protein